MCDRCGEPGLTRHGFSITERPAHRLIGVNWEGTYEDAARGALHPLLARMQALSAERGGLWRSPIVGLSWNGEDGRLRYFAGIAEDGEAKDGLETLDIPDMELASAWHGPEDGDVIGHYVGMVGWMRETGLTRDHAVFDQREEYPPDADLSGPPVLRIMLALKRS